MHSGVVLMGNVKNGHSVFSFIRKWFSVIKYIFQHVWHKIPRIYNKKLSTIDNSVHTVFDGAASDVLVYSVHLATTLISFRWDWSSGAHIGVIFKWLYNMYI